MKTLKIDNLLKLWPVNSGHFTPQIQYELRLLLKNRKRYKSFYTESGGCFTLTDKGFDRHFKVITLNHPEMLLNNVA